VAWENRQRGEHYYYYRSVREGERVRKEYVGSSASLGGQLAAEGNRIVRERRKVAALREKQERERLEALIAPVLELSEAAQVLTQAHLLANGYRRHK
jgi:hypothetical protein